MTMLPLITLAAALATVVFVALAALVIRGRTAAPDVAEPTADAAPLAVADGDFGVPFTHLGVDVEAPSAPDWSTHVTPALRAKAAKADAAATLAIAHVDRATSILHDHVRREPASVAAWLMLLELYRTHGREQALAELARDFGERFHAPRAVAGADALRGGADGGLEAFPPVMRLVTMLWGTHECRDLLERLSRDRSEGRRLGLSRAAYVDIATLARILDALLAELDADHVEETKVRAAWQTASYVAQV